ncbi:mitochondrial translocase of outer membrane Tom6 subunit [Andalucia godoyi]|uniref:Mitochondrial translocase of outer membrane Tom6 subunit n=1 Tax=Andalucia godoyi TaxID=505711 RepID=A0A8K0AHN0_ANDGO|nr:mitochondrial translocase of outer membrane Tom6 subunit [Andalucia godoyi]|eukprot:ANDGO_06446.mRNA.1 mitochondrial translocase of outer membrane Tom6 subunit
MTIIDAIKSEFAIPEKRSKTLRFLRNIGIVVGAIVVIKNYGDFFLPPPAEELAKMVQEQAAQQMQLMQQIQ